jgi:hypothetical protein
VARLENILAAIFGSCGTNCQADVVSSWPEPRNGGTGARPERCAARRVFSSAGENLQEPDMKRIHVIALVAAGAFVSFGPSAVAQTVSDGDSYQQGYAAGASAKERNSFDAFDNGYRAGKTAQSSTDSQIASTQAFNNGYEAGKAQAEQEKNQAYNDGYQSRAAQERVASARAFDDGYDAGAARQAARDDALFP